MRIKFLAALLAGAALLGTVATGHAKVIELKVRSGSEVNLSVLAFGGSSGTITNVGAINGINYAATGTSTELPNHVGLSINTVGTTAASTVKTLTYELTVTGLTGQASILAWQDLFSGLNPVVGDTVSNSVTRVYFDAANVKYGTANLVYDSGFPLGCGFPAAYSCSASGAISLPTVFSMTQILFVTYKPGSTGLPVTSSSAFAAVPEPTSLALLGSGLLLAGWMFRRRRSSKIS